MILRYLGLAEESEFNQSPAPEAVFHVDVSSIGIDTPGDTQLIHEGGIGRSARQHRPGFYAPSGNIVYAFDVRTIAYLLKWALGGYEFKEEAEDFNKHEIFGVDDQKLPSFVARCGKDEFEHVFSGCVINSLEINVAGEFAQATADIVAAKDGKTDTKDKSDLLLPDEYPMAFHEVTATIAGSSAEVVSFSLTINNNISAEEGRILGQRHPYRLYAGTREITMNKTLVFKDTDELERYWGGSEGPSESGSDEFAVVLNFDSGNYGNMEIQLPRFIYTQVQQQPSGRSKMDQETTGRAFADEVSTEDGDKDSEILATVLNDENKIEA